MNFMRSGLPLERPTPRVAGRETEPRDPQSLFFTVREGTRRRHLGEGANEISFHELGARTASIDSCVQGETFSRNTFNSNNPGLSALSILTSGEKSSDVAQLLFPPPPNSDVATPNFQTRRFERLEGVESVASAEIQSPSWSNEDSDYGRAKRLRLENPFFLNAREPSNDENWDEQSFVQMQSVLFQQDQQSADFEFPSRQPTEEDLATPSREKVPTNFEKLFNNSIPGSERSLERLTTPRRITHSESEPSTSKSNASKTRASTTKNFTARTETTAMSDPTSFSIVVVTEARGCAVGEVGFAAIDLKNPVLTLCQMNDFETYPRTIAKINVFNPVELIFPETITDEANNSDMYKTLLESFAKVKIIAMKRQYFNASSGQESMRILCLRESPIDHITLRKHFALSAASALLKYIEIEHNVIYAKESLSIRYESASDAVAIDVESAKRLELIKGLGKMINPDKYSLLGVMDFTVTLGGKRRLRAEILQPFTDLGVITERQNNVTLLVENKTFLTTLHKSLSAFSEVERLLWLCRKIPNLRYEKKANEILTGYILLLKSTLDDIPTLCDVLNESQEDYFIRIKQSLQDECFKKLAQIINEKIHEDAKPSRSYQMSEMNRYFMLKDNINGLLDVARNTYSKLVDEVRELIAKLAEEYRMPLKMTQSATYGFHAQYTIGPSVNQDVPAIFTEVKYQGKVCHLCTDEMFFLNVRIRRIVQEIQLISNVVLLDLLKDVRPMVSCVCSLCEHVSELDVLCSLAKISSSKDYVRPSFGRILKVEAGRHPILDHIEPTRPIPNNVNAKKSKNFNIITGPNMGGKTIYVLKVALLQIMAQIGCYVPADSAEFRIADMIFLRKNSLESIEMSCSSLSLELKELMYAMKFSTGSSLIIIDEICAGTDFQGGTALAWAICEEFLKKPAFTFLTTHLHYLTNMDQIFFNVTNYNMEAIDLSEDSPYEPLVCTYRLMPGVTQIANYGLKLILTSNLPDSIKNYSLTIAERLCRKRAGTLTAAVNPQGDVLQAMIKTEKLEKIFHDLYDASKSDSFNLEIVRSVQNMVLSEILSDEDSDDEQDDGNISGKGRMSTNSESESSKKRESISLGRAKSDTPSSSTYR